MALGGWIYHTYSIPSFDHTNDALFESNVIDPMITLISGISGWSVQTAKTKYVNAGSDTAWFFEMVHTSGAVLSVVWAGYAPGGSIFIEASNVADLSARTAANTDQRVCFSYWPPGNSGAGAANPAVSGYVPSDGIGFYLGSRSSSVASGHTSRFQFIARDDDLIIVCQYDSSYIDTVTLLGSCLEPYHASDSGTRKAEAHIMRWANAYSTDRPGGYFAADNTTRVWYYPQVFLDNYSFLTSSVNNAAPWSYVPALIGCPIKVGATGIDSGVTATSGFKGRISTEWFRWCSPSCGTKQQLVSGNLIHVAEGVVLGWDPTNGAMS